MEKAFIYTIGIVVVLGALAVSVIGLRSGKFPGERGTFLLLAVGGILVLVTGSAAILESRHEQKLRREELAKEAEEKGEVPVGESGRVAAESEQRTRESPEAQGEQNLSQDASQEERTSQPTVVADSRAKALFTERCATCHALSAADATGNIGPNLDNLSPEPTVQRVLGAIRIGGEGSGRMPANLVRGDDADRVAEFVSRNSAR
ncbi:MAG: c-type cytochrome [Solirubrobacterales bacterium]